jgi:hypothetical protein
MNTEDLDERSVYPQDGSKNVGIRNLPPEDLISIHSRSDAHIDSQD